MNSLQYTYSVHTNLSQLLKVSSHLKSTLVDMLLSSRVGCAQVDRHRLWVILASSQVMFLYLSDSQVYLRTFHVIENSSTAEQQM